MGCDSSYMNPTDSEQRAKKTARLLIWADQRHGINECFMKASDRALVENEANNYYAKEVGQTVFLCDWVKRMGKDNLDEFLRREFRDKEARELMDWIDEHQESDRRKVEAKIENNRLVIFKGIEKSLAELSTESLMKIRDALK